MQSDRLLQGPALLESPQLRLYTHAVVIKDSSNLFLFMERASAYSVNFYGDCFYPHRSTNVLQFRLPPKKSRNKLDSRICEYR
jgi:hypothetical protein